MRILHLADTHIKNLKFHEEYKTVFNEIYRIAKEQNIDYIVHCGDIAHTKTQISPEFVEIAGDFFKNLASIAPTYIILGNHDANLKNSSRQDAISPIINALNLPNLKLFKYSGEFIVNEQLTFNILSQMDEDKWAAPTDLSKINIALFHGSVSGVKTDIGYVMEHGDHSVDIFKGHDYAFLGDIHKTNQVLDLEGRIRYPGSTLQQNFSETDDKGFLIWDIKSKSEFNCTHFVIPNPSPFVTIILENDGTVPLGSIKSGARLRIVADKSISLEKVKKATEVVTNRYAPATLTFVNKATASIDEGTLVSGMILKKENLRDLNVQEKLIRNYLKDFKADDSVLNKVILLNQKYSSAIDESDQIFRNINWKLKSLEWSNLFNYGDNNKIDFTKLEGIVGIFGKNFSGKSSIIDSLLYTMYNTTSKNNRKNYNIINQNQERGYGKVEIDIDGESYTINRKSEKYVKKLKGETTNEAKTDVEFTSSGTSLTGLARTDTDNVIRKYFGSIDDFFLTSMASQFGYLSFISEGSTKRKEILAKFLDLENFDKKFKLAKEESASVKSLLKKIEGNDYDKEISLAEALSAEVFSNLVERKKTLDTLKTSITNLNIDLTDINSRISSVPVEVIDHKELDRTIGAYQTQKASLIKENSDIANENPKLINIISKSDEFLKLVEESDLADKQSQQPILFKKIQMLQKEIASLSIEVKSSKTKFKLLEDIPCGTSFPSCKFIKDAFEAKELFPDLSTKFDEKQKALDTDTSEYNELQHYVVDKHNKKLEITKKKSEAQYKLSVNELKHEKNINTINVITKQIEKNQQKLSIYEENKETIENYENLCLQKDKMKLEMSSLTLEANLEEQKIINLYIKEGSVKEKIENLKKQKEDLANLREEYAAYDLFLACTHPNGISYNIIKQKLPEINLEIAKILTNIVNFSIYLENDGDKLDIFIKHPKYDSRPLEMGSGAERTIASTAIRLALLNVTTLPKCDIFCMDEPATALDEENMEGFVRILELVKTYFKTVILISHLDGLKDCVDTQIVIEKKEGYAYVNQ